MEFVLVAGLGAATQEVVHWYELRHKLSSKRLQSLLASKQYWVITLLMIIVAALGSWVLFGQKGLSRDIQFLVGAGFPLIFKKLVSATSKMDRTALGDNWFSDYFLLYSFRAAP